MPDYFFQIFISTFMKKAHLTRKTHKENMTFHFAPYFRHQINFWAKFAYHQTKLIMFCVWVLSITFVSQKLKERCQFQNDTRVMGQSVYRPSWEGIIYLFFYIYFFFKLWLLLIGGWLPLIANFILIIWKPVWMVNWPSWV